MPWGGPFARRLDLAPTFAGVSVFVKKSVLPAACSVLSAERTMATHYKENNMSQSPLQKVRKQYGSKESLAKKVVEILDKPEGEETEAFEHRVSTMSNRPDFNTRKPSESGMPATSTGRYCTDTSKST